MAELDFRVFDRTKTLDICGVRIVPFDGPRLLTLSALTPSVEHGRIRSLGFVIEGRLLYLPDFSRIPEESFQRIQAAAPALSAAVIGTVRIQPHPSLGSLPQTLATARRLGARTTLLTELADGITHEAWFAVAAAVARARASPPRGWQPRPRSPWTAYADYTPPSAMTAPADQILYKSLHSLVGIRDDDIGAIVDLAMNEIARHVDALPVTTLLAPAYDGLFLAVD